MGTRRMATTGPRPAPEPPPPADPLLRRALIGVAWIVALVAIILLLGRLGSGQLSTPPLLDRSALQDWLATRDAVTVAFALVRLVGLVLAWYLLVVTALGLAARISRIPALVRLADLATVPAVRKVLGAIAGVGLTASAASLMAANLLPDRAPAEAGATDVGSRMVLERVPDGSDVILRRLPDQDGTSTMRVEEAPGQEAPEQAPTPREWTAAPGDHLWHIAEATLTDAWGRAPSDAELAPYWESVVETNRPRLSDPGNPDLVFPGQVFRLPEPPPAPTPPPAP
ncbi:hypothetical protein PO878_13970 [Iamia majanohamensis]|uniref:LysM domain-containing protein n=1 Tax=Iamia majanohamensis TaxID=467976 RepID=A0AAE9Y3W1_9ACTN|nr:hypothetical protein [Iamia majanohamensis]WCO65607.1 hypothetical protein PO878_13970 [Iamia majanohamensis]